MSFYGRLKIEIDEMKNFTCKEKLDATPVDD